MANYTVDVYLDSGAFVEREHPRGQPQNKGEFVAKGKGSSAASKRPAAKPASVQHAARGSAQSHLIERTAHTKLPPHIAAMRIPPAWTDVKFSPDPRATLQVVGKDAAGRLQYVYSKEFAGSQAEAKFARIKELDKKFDKIYQQNEQNRVSNDSTVRDLADCTKLIIHTGVRPGSDADTSAKVKAYGATTLESQHIHIDGSQVSLRFIGKKGVALNIPVHDVGLARMLRARAKGSPTKKLFPGVNEKSLLTYVHGFDGGGFKSKDFRTLHGTRTALEWITKVDAPQDAKTYKKAVMTVAKAVAEKLGNTPTVALQSYINPVVFAQWRAQAGV